MPSCGHLEDHLLSLTPESGADTLKGSLEVPWIPAG